MAQEINPSRPYRNIFRLMQRATATTDGFSIGTITHRIPIRHPAGDVPRTYTVYLTPDTNGTFVVTCRELPGILTSGEDEEEALDRAKEAIEEALGARRSSPDFLC